MGVIGQNGVDVGERRFDPASGRRMREAKHARSLHGLGPGEPVGQW
jgi:hypothetical protein